MEKQSNTEMERSLKVRIRSRLGQFTCAKRGKTVLLWGRLESYQDFPIGDRRSQSHENFGLIRVTKRAVGTVFGQKMTELLLFTKIDFFISSKNLNQRTD